jgi:hypothetical protein
MVIQVWRACSEDWRIGSERMKLDRSPMLDARQAHLDRRPSDGLLDSSRSLFAPLGCNHPVHRLSDRSLIHDLRRKVMLDRYSHFFERRALIRL